MDQTSFIILILLFLAAIVLLFWWMTREAKPGAQGGAQGGDEAAEALGSLLPDEEGDTSPPQTIASESIPLDPPHAADLDRAPAAPAPSPGPATEVPATAAPAETPASALPAANGGAADDLLLLKGVGPKLAVRLSELGITRFDQIAGWTESDIDRIDAELGTFKGRIRRDNWVDQAGYLARGDTAGFAAKYGNL